MRTSRRGRLDDRVRTAVVPRCSTLRRPSDRVETAARWFALVLLALAVPFLLAAGADRAQDVRDEATHTRLTAHQVVGTVTAVAVRPSRSPDGSSSGALDVTAVWTEPDGSVHTTVDTAFTSTAPGRPWPMWVDPTGRRIREPASETDAAVQGVLLAGLLAVGIATVLSGLVVGLRWWLDRARLRRWDEDWAAFRRGRDRGVTG